MQWMQKREGLGNKNGIKKWKVKKKEKRYKKEPKKKKTSLGSKYVLNQSTNQPVNREPQHNPAQAKKNDVSTTEKQQAYPQ
jgi:hypothetical protein